ncbi:hypothetical protein HYPSUDRAFT_64182 [Hypholoma sublateritium FD-334 SS-4]|uniref:Uncharacterized protein n=1 Tax=Hypholoma sublateritium (strain FD-334 SS-4) TaxID=945553 RepID=A0A0D2Q325_HYPSF|nr:hypothetical protein HYPSUDRAFT_64182 [Hypholoma sublateritium FD-334 SS-4]
MLKRQRNSSPTPAPSASTPVFADEPPDRDTKRRRTAAPELDGRARGWATQPDGDDDDEYISQDEAPDPALPRSEEYKSANTMLRELHTLHQHRLLFASSPQPTSSPAADKWHVPLLTPPPQKCGQPGGPSVEEATRVAQQYEATNRNLGLLFLSRRRKLDPSDEIPDT